MGKYNTRRLAKKGEIDRFSSATYLYHTEGNSDNYNLNFRGSSGAVNIPYTAKLPPYQPFGGAIRYNKDPDNLGTELVIGVNRDNSEGYVDVITYKGSGTHMNIPEIVKLEYPLKDTKVYKTNSTTLIEPKPKPPGYTAPVIRDIETGIVVDTENFIYTKFPDLRELSAAGLSIPKYPKPDTRKTLDEGWFVFYVISAYYVKLRCATNYPNRLYKDSYHVLGRLVPIIEDKKISKITLNYLTKSKKIKQHEYEDWRWLQYSMGPINTQETNPLPLPIPYPDGIIPIIIA